MERGNQRFRCDGFPSPLDPHPFLSPTRGHPWTPKSFLCNSLVQKLQNSAYAEFWDGLPVLALELGTLFPNSAYAEFGGFGLWLLVRQGFLGVKAPLQSVFAKDTAFFSAKAQNSRIRLTPNSGDCLLVSCFCVWKLLFY